MPFDKAASNSRGLANVKRLITEPECMNLPFEKYYFEGFLVYGNHPDGGHPTGHEHCTFPQYLVSLWNICTLQRPHGIAEWYFRMEFGDEKASQDQNDAASPSFLMKENLKSMIILGGS